MRTITVYTEAVRNIPIAAADTRTGTAINCLRVSIVLLFKPLATAAYEMLEGSTDRELMSSSTRTESIEREFLALIRNIDRFAEHMGYLVTACLLITK